ncbi:hypothetical protein F4810DRAFT_694692 [Camillea tinctor]|nr:hypothetical protein F4810DRAFT_694692 [Camillea tinctor]
MKPAPFLSPGSARKYNLDESTGLIIKSQSSSSASSQSNPPGNSDLSMGGSDNSNDQSGPKDASMMDVDDDDDYAPAADDPDDPEEYEDDDDGDLLGDVSMMSIDPNNLSGLSGSSIAQGSSPLPANASAMNISPGSAGGGGNNGGPVLRTFATLEFQNLPLADSFKILVSRCLAVDPEECPSLSQLLRVCKAEVAKIGDVDALTSQFTSMLMDADTEEYPDP